MPGASLPGLSRSGVERTSRPDRLPRWCHSSSAPNAGAGESGSEGCCSRVTMQVTKSAPRTRGDGPNRQVWWRRRSHCSPHPRGWSQPWPVAPYVPRRGSAGTIAVLAPRSPPPLELVDQGRIGCLGRRLRLHQRPSSPRNRGQGDAYAERCGRSRAAASSKSKGRLCLNFGLGIDGIERRRRRRRPCARCCTGIP